MLFCSLVDLPIHPEKIMRQEGRHPLVNSGLAAQSIHDEYIYFPETVERDFVYNPILDACYKYLLRRRD